MIADKGVSILGCGWLGLPLAKKLIDEGYAVKGSTTHTDKLAKLSEARIKPFLINLNQRDTHSLLYEFLGNEYLIIAVPPRIKSNPHYVDYLKVLIDYINLSNIKKVIFISSTSVYPNCNSMVNEENTETPESKSGQALREVEAMLIANETFETTILRMAGLCGYDRKPGRFLAAKTNLDNGQGAVNLIHQDDCVSIIENILKREMWGEVFNCCSDEHPTRKDFYTSAAMKLGLPIPTFKESENFSYKVVSNIKLKRKLNYKFKYNDPMDMI
ncbi:MAG: SDR family oxidoreductase [Cyclobacteriaceae bacterium]